MKTRTQLSVLAGVSAALLAGTIASAGTSAGAVDLDQLRADWATPKVAAALEHFALGTLPERTSYTKRWEIELLNTTKQD